MALQVLRGFLKMVSSKKASWKPAICSRINKGKYGYGMGHGQPSKKGGHVNIPTKTSDVFGDLRDVCQVYRVWTQVIQSLDPSNMVTTSSWTLLLLGNYTIAVSHHSVVIRGRS